MAKQLRIVAAIDFGTCNTRIAFARLSSLIGIPRTQDIDIFVMDNWENAPDGLKTMAPTSVLFNMTGDAIAYGFDAEDQFQSLKPSELRSRYLFKYFKMELHKKNVSNIQCIMHMYTFVCSCTAICYIYNWNHHSYFWYFDFFEVSMYQYVGTWHVCMMKEVLWCMVDLQLPFPHIRRSRSQ